MGGHKGYVTSNRDMGDNIQYYQPQYNIRIDGELSRESIALGMRRALEAHDRQTAKDMESQASRGRRA
jgi:hypothetical protein